MSFHRNRVSEERLYHATLLSVIAILGPCHGFMQSDLWTYKKTNHSNKIKFKKSKGAVSWSDITIFPMIHMSQLQSFFPHCPFYFFFLFDPLIPSVLKSSVKHHVRVINPVCAFISGAFIDCWHGYGQFLYSVLWLNTACSNHHGLISYDLSVCNHHEHC